MKIISHRGNLLGPDPKAENTIKQIKLAIKKGFDVEIDVWVENNKIYLGHDKPEQEVPYNFFSKYGYSLWIHCKNIEALNFFRDNSSFLNYNYFWHDQDKVTMTSKGIPWCYPGTYVFEGVTVHCGSDWRSVIKENSTILGICTDYPLM